MDWFRYDNGLRLERVKLLYHMVSGTSFGMLTKEACFVFGFTLVAVSLITLFLLGIINFVLPQPFLMTMRCLLEWGFLWVSVSG